MKTSIRLVNLEVTQLFYCLLQKLLNLINPAAGKKQNSGSIERSAP